MLRIELKRETNLSKSKGRTPCAPTPTPAASFSTIPACLWHQSWRGTDAPSV